MIFKPINKKIEHEKATEYQITLSKLSDTNNIQYQFEFVNHRKFKMSFPSLYMTLTAPYGCFLNLLLYPHFTPS